MTEKGSFLTKKDAFLTKNGTFYSVLAAFLKIFRAISKVFRSFCYSFCEKKPLECVKSNGLWDYAIQYPILSLKP